MLYIIGKRLPDARVRAEAMRIAELITDVAYRELLSAWSRSAKPEATTVGGFRIMGRERNRLVRWGAIDAERITEFGTNVLMFAQRVRLARRGILVPDVTFG